MKPKRKVKKKSKSKVLFYNREESNDSYHKPRFGTGMRPFLSSSVIKAVLNRELGREETSSKSFGHKFHLFIECCLNDPEGRFMYMDKREGKRHGWTEEDSFKKHPQHEKYPVIGTPTELVNLKCIIESWKVFWKAQYTDGRKMIPEKSYYTSHEAILAYQGDLPDSLRGLHGFLLENRLNIKTRPDLILQDDEALIIFDWKSTRHDQIGQMKGDIFNTYHYMFSLGLYILNLYYHGLVGDRHIEGHIVMLFKGKSPYSPVDFSFTMESKPFQRYMDDIVMKLKRSWTKDYKSYLHTKGRHLVRINL